MGQETSCWQSVCKQGAGRALGFFQNLWGKELLSALQGISSLGERHKLRPQPAGVWGELRPVGLPLPIPLHSASTASASFVAGKY